MADQSIPRHPEDRNVRPLNARQRKLAGKIERQLSDVKVPPLGDEWTEKMRQAFDLVLAAVAAAGRGQETVETYVESLVGGLLEDLG